MIDASKLGRIKWESRRGMRELDLMLLPFVEEEVLKLSPDDLAAYCDLLKASDLELVRWFNGTAEPDSPSRKHMIAYIIKCHHARNGLS